MTFIKNKLLLQSLFIPTLMCLLFLIVWTSDFVFTWILSRNDKMAFSVFLRKLSQNRLKHSISRTSTQFLCSSFHSGCGGACIFEECVVFGALIKAKGETRKSFNFDEEFIGCELLCKNCIISERKWLILALTLVFSRWTLLEITLAIPFVNSLVSYLSYLISHGEIG